MLSCFSGFTMTAVVIALLLQTSKYSFVEGTNPVGNDEPVENAWTCDAIMKPDLWCQNSMEIERGFFESRNGLQIAYWIYYFSENKEKTPAPREEAGGDLQASKQPIPLIIVVNGGPGLSHSYQLPRRALACLHPGRRIVFYDQGGTGLSALPNNASLHSNPEYNFLLDINYYTEELSLLVKSLQRHYGDGGKNTGIATTYHIFAHSWGTQIALQFALDNKPGHDLLSMILSGPLHDSTECVEAMWDPKTGTVGRLPKYFRARLWEVWELGEEWAKQNEREVQAMLDSVYSKFYYRTAILPDCARESFDHINQEIAVQMLGWMDFMPSTPKTREWDGKLTNWTVKNRLGELSNLPILLLSGEYDIISPAVVQSMHEALKMSERILYKNVAHHLVLDIPKQSNRDIADFVLRVESSCSLNQSFHPEKTMTGLYSKNNMSSCYMLPHKNVPMLNFFSWWVVVLTIVSSFGIGSFLRHRIIRRQGYEAA